MSAFFKLGNIGFSDANFDFKEIGIVRFADADFKQLATNFILLLTMGLIFYVAFFLDERKTAVEILPPTEVKHVTPQKSGLSSFVFLKMRLV